MRKTKGAGERERAKAARALAIDALAFLAADPDRLGRFLALSGIGPDQVRAAAQEPGFLAGVLEHVQSDESLLLAFAEHNGIGPQQVGKALRALGGRPWERDIP